jgi:hypothetical protein
MALVEKNGKIVDFIETTGEYVDPITRKPLVSKVEEPKKEEKEEVVEEKEHKEEKKFYKK